MQNSLTSSLVLLQFMEIEPLGQRGFTPAVLLSGWVVKHYTITLKGGAKHHSRAAWEQSEKSSSTQC